MNINILNPRKALNKAFLKVKPNRIEIELFKNNLITLLDRTNEKESEEFHKNLVSDFLKDTYYKQNHFINTKGRNDLVIHNGNQATSSVGVILEAKKPTNKAEMISQDNLNKKAFQELVLYYLRERITHKNLEVKHLVATNINEWFIFDAMLFDRLFAQNKVLVKQFEDFEAGRLADTKTDFFYKQIAEPFIQNITTEIECTYFNIQNYQTSLRNEDKNDDNTLIDLFKVYAPQHMLKLPFANDSNSLDKRFYAELLHIIGLTETKEGGKKLIGRNKEGARLSGSLLEDTIIQLDSMDKLSRVENLGSYGTNNEERLFSIALELCITWVNRILFLKLLEGQLLNYHKGNKQYAFLNLDKIKEYDDLNSLFFQVLAKKYDQRNEDVKKLFESVPYLNSSLFEPTELEHQTLFISNLKDDKTIPLYTQTVLKDTQGKKMVGSMNTLAYFFAFLDAYDFSSEGKSEIQEDNKTLINASVLGLIFEKINGYKDGSFFTPGFITMYMCRETIRKAVVQKFNETYTKKNFTSLSGNNQDSSSLQGSSQESNSNDGSNQESTPILRGAKQNPTPLLRGAGGVSFSNNGDKTSNRREIIPYNPKLKELARDLRNNSTKSEIALWNELKGKFEGGYDFHRQKPLDNYIADFFCYELKLVIEIDGMTHEWEETQKKDHEKECKLHELGLNTLRFSDTEVFEHLEYVLDKIKEYIQGYESGDLTSFHCEDTPLNPLSRGDFHVPQHSKRALFEFKSLDDIYEHIGEGRMFSRDEANTIVNSLKICDPAVGSGHFLVSALNEMIAVKNDLKILQDREGKRLKEYQFVVENDELIITDEEGELFEYHPTHKESQRVQETLFHEKQTIIENCLFGVDINPNSVKICRLRLWIELLKNAYYKQSSDTPLLRGVGGVLETLPNIDINIKCGNSLVSRFAIDADLSQALKKSKWNIDSYKLAVDTYRNAENKEQKREMERLIKDIKSDFRSEISQNDPKLQKLRKLSGELYNITHQVPLFERSEKEKAEWNKNIEKLNQEIQKIEVEIEEIKANKIYENAFEWRFEFPEVLDDQGNFIGFDVVIGNPPYVSFQEVDKNSKPVYEKTYKTANGKYDIYLLFNELSIELNKNKGITCLIYPNKFINSNYGKHIKEILLKNEICELHNFNDLPVFTEAITYPAIIMVKKGKQENNTFKYYSYSDLSQFDNINEYLKIKQTVLDSNIWILSNAENSNLLDKIIEGASPLNEISSEITQGIRTGSLEIFYNNANNKNVENELLIQIYSGKSVKRYLATLTTNDNIIYPYINNDAVELVDFPKFSKYVSENKEVLLERKDSGKTFRETNKKFYEYWDRKPISFKKPKIIFPDISNINNFTLDEEGTPFLNSCYAIYLKDESFYKYILGIINSKLIMYFISKVCPSVRGGYFRFKTSYIGNIPIKFETKIQLKIEFLVSQIIDLKKDNPAADTTEMEAEIDKMVYGLYGLTEEEVKIVEGR